MAFTLKPSDLHRPTAKWYSEYLQSPRWVDFRAGLLRKRGIACERCKVNASFSLHHLTYAHLFNELIQDVQFLCKECHTKAHAEDDIPYLFLIYREDLKEVKEILQYIGPTKTQPTPKPRRLGNYKLYYKNNE